VKDASSQLANAKSRLLRARKTFAAAKAGGRTGRCRARGWRPGKAIGDRDGLQRHHIIGSSAAEGAATKDELAANELALSKAQAEVNRVTAVKKEFERQVPGHFAGDLAVQQAQSDVAVL